MDARLESRLKDVAKANEYIAKSPELEYVLLKEVLTDNIKIRDALLYVSVCSNWPPERIDDVLIWLCGAHPAGTMNNWCRLSESAKEAGVEEIKECPDFTERWHYTFSC